MPAIGGAIFTPGDALDDAAGYCRELTSHMVEQHGVSTLFGNTVVDFLQNQRALAALRFADRDELPVDVSQAPG